MTALATIRSVSPDTWAVSTPFNEAVVEHFKSMPGCWYEKETKEWCGPFEAVSEVLTTLEAAKVIVASSRPKGERPRYHTAFRADGLYEYQNDGVDFLINRWGGRLLADDMGLGKSPQTLRAIEARVNDSSTLFSIANSKILILCPAVVVPHWQEQAEKWLGVTATKIDRTCPEWSGIGVTSYDTFRSLDGWWRPCNILVLDELHYLMSPTAQRTKAVLDYLGLHARWDLPRPITYGLTGTPMTARPKDLWQPLDILFPKRFGSRWQFEKRYCDGQWQEIPGREKPVWNANGRSNLEELGRRLRNGGLMLRRTKEEVLELPERQRICLPVEIPERAKSALAKANSLFSNYQALGKVLSVIEEHKLKAAVELAQDLVAQGRRPLLFTLRKETAWQLGKQLGAPVVTGEVAASQRRRILVQSSVGVATVYSVTTGIDLTGYDVGIFVGLDWVPSTLLQAEARLHRIGQGSKTTFYYLVGMGTVDESVRSKVIERLEDFQTVVGNAADEGRLAAALKGAKSQDELLKELFESVMGEAA